MIDVLTIYNLAVKYPNTVDLVREVEKMARTETIAEIKEIIDEGCDGAECYGCKYCRNPYCDELFIASKIINWAKEQKDEET